MEHTVHSQITIDAPPDVVWGNITDLRTIEATEASEPFFYRIGLPRPIEAKMTCEEAGCIRTGHWEQGLQFEGTITDITPGKSYWLTLQAQTSDVAAGNPLRAMVSDGYEIEETGDGQTVLHLYTTYRITTRINAYAVRWIDFLMRDIQGYILRIEKQRSELATGL